MFARIAGFELRLLLRSPLFWATAAIFFLLGFGITASDNVSIGTPGAVQENSPSGVARVLAAMSILYMFALVAFVSGAIVRDTQSGFAPIIGSAPITARPLVLGRFTGAMTAVLLSYLAVPAGMGLGTMMPWVDPETVGPGGVGMYLYHYAVVAVPTLLMLGAALFALVAATRSMTAGYVGVIFFVIAYLSISAAAASQPGWREAAATWEPLGIAALQRQFRYWSTAELNMRWAELAGPLLANRLIVLALAAAFLLLAVRRFSLVEGKPGWWSRRRAARARSKALADTDGAPADRSITIARPARVAELARLWSRIRLEVGQMVRNPGFAVLLLIALMQLVIYFVSTTSAYGTASYILNEGVVAAVRGSAGLVLLIIAGFFGGELVWRERERRIDALVDAMPMPAWQIIVPKVLAIALVLFSVVLVTWVAATLFQLAEGVVRPDPWLVARAVVLPEAASSLLIAVLAILFQVVAPNKYLGWALLLIWFVIGVFLSNLGYTNPLYTYGASVPVPVSDMNGVDEFAAGPWLGLGYWGGFALILMVVAHFMWPRGGDTAVLPRARRALANAGRGAAALSALGAAIMAVTGFAIHDRIKVRNLYETVEDGERRLADFERAYLVHEDAPQPRVRAIAMAVDLFPAERRMAARGSYRLVNETGAPLRDIHVRMLDPTVAVDTLSLPGARRVVDDRRHGYRVFRLDQPLAPGAAILLSFATRIDESAFTASNQKTGIVANGTFLNKMRFAPLIGMNRSGLLEDRTARRRQGLPAELRARKLEDRRGLPRNYLNADWTTSTITVSTSADQVPIAPGRRVSDVIRNGRRTARFVTTAPILDFFSIQSARYAIARGAAGGGRIATEVYHDPRQGWNVPRMRRAITASLDYYEDAFGPYQFDHARIVEFPDYAGFAQAFAGTMPYSEGIGFTLDLRDPDEVDFMTFVIAHELAHQYWAHQVVGADVQGQTLLSETLAEYSALMVMRRVDGPDKVRRFLKQSLDSYLAGRQGEAVAERPLARVEDQGYIHYRKGGVVMYRLAEVLGEDRVNAALAAFLADWRFKGPPYPRSVDLIARLRQQARTPAEQALITDLLERITLYDIKASDAVARRVGDGWETRFTIVAAKAHADGKGRETRAPMAEPVAIGAFTARPGVEAFRAADVLATETRPIVDGRQQVTIRTRQRPAFVGVDPYVTLIDRDSEDNLVEVP